MIFRLSLIVFGAFSLSVSSPLMAWGGYAHQTTADIAQQNISAKSRAEIRRLMQTEALLGTPDCQLKSLRDASIWPDCIRSDRVRWGYTGPWHYQNVDICKPFNMRSACANGNCVSAQIDRNAALLADKNLPDHIRLEALTFLVHFAGDMHMPLHSGDRSDRGGNDVDAAYGAIEGRTNLHSLWDGPLAERAISDGINLAVRYDNETRAKITAGSTEDWALEAWQVARDYAYPTAEDKAACGEPLKSRAIIDNDEIVKLIPIARLQIQRAGLRIAMLIDKALN